MNRIATGCRGRLTTAAVTRAGPLRKIPLLKRTGKLTGAALASQAAAQYANEAIRKFAIRTLLRRENVREARHVLNRGCIADEVFRYQSMLLTDYFLNPSAVCEKAHYITGNETFTDELRGCAREKSRLMGGRYA